MKTRITITFEETPTDEELLHIGYRMRRFIEMEHEHCDFLNEKTNVHTWIRKTPAGYAIRVCNKQRNTDHDNA